MEAINSFFIEDGHLDSTKNFNDEKNSKDKIIYEVIRINNGEPLFLEVHLKRMEKSFNLMDKSFPYEYNKIAEYLERVISANHKKEGNVKITFNIDEDLMKVFYIKHIYPTDEMYKNGVDTILYHGERHNPNAKVIDCKFREKVNEEIKKKNAFEAILVDNNGYITEGSKSNIFLIKDNKLFTSKIEAVLPGVTRGKIIEIAKSENIDFDEKNSKYTELEEIDAMFISGTSPGILPISKVDSIIMNVDNEIMRKLMDLYNNKNV
ncbi:aminotransferase class IV [Clostridium gasigenes]|uniref:aminotransferase class IV n=1 Tax=Clostridium gasigenes TaxID=94869 RepID=UPI001438571D|nr:aminotransferase class IV [Clostridium gasigenes]MBU3136014.1 aminotransferase class IV [Clostridium gasigenes]NKF06909.1 aminotransferase class IV [Clostridium gasigenes]QSW19826.1 aminotransferase class IV family protein [Clostridium gasigenes]